MRNGSMHVLNRRPVDGPVFTVDPADELVDLPPQALVRRDAFARRHRHLDEAHAPTQVWVVAEEAIVREEPARNALRVVEAIDAEQQPMLPAALDERAFAVDRCVAGGAAERA